MAEAGAPTHDFFSSDLAAKGWIPGISWGIQAAGGNRQTNEARISGTPSYTGQIRESRSILDSPSGPSGSMMPGAAGVSGAMRTPVAPSGPSQSGVYTPEEQTLGRIIGMAGRLGRRQGSQDTLAGKASGGRGRAGGPGSNTDNVYSAGRDNIVGSSYAAGVSGSAAVNQGTNYGVMGGENNRVNQMFFRTGDNSPMAVGAQPTATSGSGKPASGTGRSGSVTKRRSAGGTTATPTASTPSGGAAKGGKKPSATPTAAPTPASPTAATPTTTPATPAQQTRPNLKTGNTGATPATPATTTTSTPPPATGGGTSFPLTPMSGTPTTNGPDIPPFLAEAEARVATKAAQSATPSVSAQPGPTTDPLPITPAYRTPTSAQQTIKWLATATNAKTTVMPATTSEPTARIPSKATGDTVDNQAIDPLIRYGVGKNAGPFSGSFPAVTSGTPRGPGLRERFSAMMGNTRKRPGQSTTDAAPPGGMVRPTEEWPGGALGGGSGVRRDGSFTVGDPLMDAAYAREQAGEPAPEGPYTEQFSAIRPSDTFKKIKSMASRAQRRAGA